jgi:signal transduction histidine kinase
MRWWRADSIAARIAVTVVAGFILGNVALGVVAALTKRIGERPIDAGSSGIIVTWWGVLSINAHRNPLITAGRIAAIAQMIDAVSQGDRPRVITSISGPLLHVLVSDTPDSTLSNERSEGAVLLRQLIMLALGDRASRLIVSTRAAGDLGDGVDARQATAGAMPAPLTVEMALSDGQWLRIVMLDHTTTNLDWWLLPAMFGVLLLLAAALSVWTGRWLARPISEFAVGAERLGVDIGAPALEETGTHELRTASRAFNGMQARLRRFLADRTEMLAAISHDLKTPLTRLRLRAEFVGDEDQQRRMLADLDEMSAMIESTLAFAREDGLQEQRMLVDFGALVVNVCDNAADAGGEVTCSAPRGLDVTCRPSSVIRAVANLIDNAIKYGRVARVAVVREPGFVLITIDDDGPGIPDDEHERVFAPFYRLERSRNRDSGGTGLGLAVARTVAREHGGDVTLANIPGGGLRVRMELPMVGPPESGASTAAGPPASRGPAAAKSLRNRNPVQSMRG